jgi:hypothetical protein
VFGTAFAHYVSYGATDQQTVRNLAGSYTGILVPGTVAAFQREGTGGFVLSLSATPASPEYAIDPRFPLFQQALSRPKRSHRSLAEALGAPGLVRSRDPNPRDFTPTLVRTIARSWAEFNGTYRSRAGGKFAKYARRLGRPVESTESKPPTFVLAPYLAVSNRTDPWWELSKSLFDRTEEHVEDVGRCIRVIAAKDVSALEELIEDVPEERLAVWPSGLDEITSTSGDLGDYARTIQRASEGGRSLFALYGGFFSVLMNNLGLSGASHGIGYGEYRNWIELPTSGPPPARYYLPQLHRYVQPDEATRLFLADSRLSACGCQECNGDPPLGLDYHALMRHSVRCREREITEWAGLSLGDMVTRLDEEATEFRQVLHASGLPEVVISRTERQAAHLARWVDALESV